MAVIISVNFPHGLRSHDTLMDKVWMAIFITAIILPVNLSFMALFTAGGTYQVPNHRESNVKIKADKVIGRRGVVFLENLVFLFYTLFFDRMRRSRALARYFSIMLLALDSVFSGLRYMFRRASAQYENLRVGMHFLYQTRQCLATNLLSSIWRVKKRGPQAVFMELHVAMKLREESELREGMHEKIFQQARHELDNGWVQLSYVLLSMGWGITLFILLVHTTLIRYLMGRSAENKVLQVNPLAFGLPHTSPAPLPCMS
ncbi:hypothetical protein CYMTET_8391 [Cymbomonas tetramitiformis]|uniref:Uncharacterized protein n=1 Tax=Cymbomonas tetramitiformis TaxID=36881 RepID=A0AAE0GTH5_9CHLO|nr:hypothetical protein CYMTET_8391 [Cymbomonas tetramitiformis]